MIEMIEVSSRTASHFDRVLIESLFLAIRHLASYYSSVLSSSSNSSNKRQKLSSTTTSPSSTPRVLLLTDDAANLKLAQSASIPTLTIRQYVDSLPSDLQTKLVDLLAVDGTGLDRDGKGGKRGKALYSEYLPTSVLQAGVKAGKLFQGHFNPSQYNFREVCLSLSTHLRFSLH